MSSHREQSANYVVYLVARCAQTKCSSAESEKQSNLTYDIGNRRFSEYKGDVNEGLITVCVLPY